MDSFLAQWADAARTTTGLFWMAFWAFALGYVVSSLIQVFVTQERMKRSMGDVGAKSVGLGTFFGFISSSCSFAALSTTRALFTKGAGLIPALSFLLASTNLVIELGIIIAIFLSWQFVVGEYLGGILLILFTWLLVGVFKPKRLIRQAREHAKAQEGDDDEGDPPNWKQLATSREGWLQVAQKYAMEWSMVWKDVTVGFTVAGIIAVFVPRSFFQALFVGSGSEVDPAFWQVLLHTLVGPLAAFFTFIGSMGNIPLAAVLYSNGVSFAGVMAFIFSDLVVFPVLRIQAKYYGWRMALYILLIFLIALSATALVMHYGFAAFDLLPDNSSAKPVSEREFFKLDYTTVLNVIFIALSLFLWGWQKRSGGMNHGSHCEHHGSEDESQDHHHHDHGSSSTSEVVLFWLAMLAYAWLGVGLILVFLK